ncbi:MAG: response regulator [Gammaproteobacteria bacterium]|nr:response regulator [Gammaproteobacteria bacterium]
MARVLIVEDNEVNRDMLGRRLKRRGFDVAFAVDAASAVAMAHSECPDLILMDIGLGTENGLDVTQRIRAQAFGQDVAIIALTAHAMVSDRDNCIAAGCNDFETKPIEFERLLMKIREHLGPADMN